MALAMLAFTVAGTDAQTTYTWSGGGGAGNQQWGKNNNWVGVSAPSNGTTGSFVFSGSAREFAPENDRSNVSAASIVLATNSSTNTQSYTLTGTAFKRVRAVIADECHTAGDRRRVERKASGAGRGACRVSDFRNREIGGS